MMQLNQLNDEQRRAVTTTDGPLLILAGAGSGKTRVITNKIAYLIEEKNIKAYNILAITFTNKAAREMQSRVEDIIGTASKMVWISTFHAFCTKILRYEASHILYENNFTIYDTQDKQVLIKNCMQTLGIDKNKLSISSVATEISRAKDNMICVDIYEDNAQDNFRNLQIAKIYRLYQEELIKNNAMDFDDLIYNCIILFKKHKEILEKYQNKFKYIMVDEYQDTNYSQYLLIKMLSEKHKNICVVGDDDQSIYGWRGADIRNILDFEKDFDNVVQIKLEQNYRSTSNIITAAATVIKNNGSRKNKKIWTSSAKGKKISLYTAKDEKDESLYVAKKIKEFIEQGYNYNDFAVLYRANSLSRKYEEAFMEYAIPYKIYGGLKFYDRMEIKDILAYLRLIDNKSDDISLKRIINVPKRGIGTKTVEKLENYARQNQISILEAISDVDEIIGAGKAREAIKKFSVMIGALKAFAKILTVSKLLDKVLSSTNYQSLLQESQSRLDNINELKSVVEEFEKNNEDKSLFEFLQNTALSTDMDEDDKANNYVTLMTIHSAKGLEFPIVFLVAAEENIFPSSRSVMDEMKLEEERRLCYVAITRAKEKLFITRASSRTLYGKTNCNLPSRFISEIDDELIINEGESKQAYSLHQKYIEKYKIINERKKEQGQDISIGTKVFHKVFGKGMVVGKKGDNYSVAFDKVGVKTIDTSVINFEIL